MSFMPGSTVQCMNPRCETRGHWLRAELIGSEQCPNCGASLRYVPPPLSPRPHFRSRPLAARAPLRPR
jgi:hypothetical protein